MQATGSIRWCEHICRKRRLYWRALPTKIASTAVFVRRAIDPLDRLLIRLTVVDAAPADPAIEPERLVIGVEHQLLGLAEVDAHERHAAVRQLHVRRLDHQRQALKRNCLLYTSDAADE